MKKTKVLFFSPALAPYRLDLYNDLSSRVDLHLCFMNRLLAGITDGHYLAGELKANHSFLDRSFTFFGRKFHLGISQALARENPDIVVTPEFSPVTVALVLMKIFRRKVLHVVITDDNTASLHSDSLMRRVLRKIALSRIDALICVSREAAHIYEFRYGFGGAIAVVPILQAESIYAVKMKCATEKGKEIVERHGLVGKRVLLYVGRLAPEKRIDLLIRSFSRIIYETPGVYLVIVGSGPEHHCLSELVRTIGLESRVFFAGRCEGVELHAWYRVSQVLALTSELERFGAVVNEALLSGMYVVCSDRAGARCLIQAGLNGDVVDVFSETVLDIALCKWLKVSKVIDQSLLTDGRDSRMILRYSDGLRALEHMFISLRVAN